MARTFTLSGLRTRVRERADMENSNFCSDAEINRYISASYAELYDLLVKADPERFMKEQTLSADGATKDFACASDFYGTIGVDYLVSGSDGVYVSLDRVFGREVNRYDHTTTGQGVAWHPVYATAGGAGAETITPTIRILPLPEAGTYRHRYIVAPADLTADTNEVDGVSGWEEYIVLDAAIKCLEKEESPTGALERRLDKLKARIEEMVENRSVEAAGTVIDTRSEDFYDPADYWSFRR